MAFKRELVLVFVLTSFFSYSVASEYDQFWHVQGWPPSLCTVSPTPCSDPELEDFKIYGYWPSNGEGPYPIACSGCPFYMTKIESLRSKLYGYWPIIYGEEHQIGWGFNWIRYGICGESQFNKTQYFKIALKLRKNHKYDLYAILTNCGIFPNSTAEISKERFRNCISNSNEKLPILHCNTNATTERPQVSQVVLCFEVDDITLKDCPEDTKYSNCPSQFIWPARHNSSLLALPHGY